MTVKNLDVFRPEGILEAYRAVSGVFSLSRLLIDQVRNNLHYHTVVAQVWCMCVFACAHMYTLTIEDIDLKI